MSEKSPVSVRVEPSEQKRVSRRQTLGAISVLTAAGFSAGKRLYAKAAVKESLRFEPEPGTPDSG